MSCQETRAYLDAYIDSELDVATALQFEKHLSECDSCRALAANYREMNDAVRDEIPYFAAPPELAAKIAAGLRPAAAERRWNIWVMAAGIAAVAAVCVLFFQLTRRPAADEMLAQEVVSSHIRSLMANHLSDVASSDRHTVKPWFNGKLDFAPDVKDLASKGFPLVGGRLDYIGNHAAAALVYQRRQHTINLFVWPSPSSDADVGASEAIKGYNVVHWTQGHMAYWAVSDLNADELKEFARSLR